MRRWIGLAIGAATLAAGSWLLAGLAERTPSRTAGSAQIVAGSLDDLLMDLQILPLDGQPPRPFALASLDGRQVTLADLAGRPALLYFWATW
jgi:cytochrome oxidase Cu insertion factor (SCO1/SenC/PrrC family)